MWKDDLVQNSTLTSKGIEALTAITTGSEGIARAQSQLTLGKLNAPYNVLVLQELLPAIPRTSSELLAAFLSHGTHVFWNYRCWINRSTYYATQFIGGNMPTSTSSYD